MLGNRARLVLALVIGCGVFLYWGLFGAPTEYRSSAPEVLRETQDYYATEIKTREFNSQGALVRISTSERLDHFPQQLLSHLSHPKITSIKSSGTITYATAQNGVLQDDNSQIDLNISAQIEDLDQDGKSLIIQSETLSYFPPQNTVETEAAVVIFSDKVRYDAIGMKADIKQRHLTLKSNVRGTHESHR
ncbi:MAG: LPS export ABC transporter periplasmic protein LptC [Pontibacterium sp.]